MATHHRLRNVGLILAAVFCSFSVIITSAQDNPDLYTDPGGYFTMPVPEGWEDTSTPPLGQFKHENGAVLTVGAMPSEDIAAAKTIVIGILAPELVDVKPTQTNDIPLPNGLWTQDLYLLPDGRVDALIAQHKEGIAYMMLLQAPTVAATQAVTPVLNQTLIGFVAGEPLDLSDKTALILGEEQLDDLDAYVTSALEQFGVPGASVAVVQNGQVIFSKGYGVTSLEDGHAVDGDTLFMIGSTTKSMTSFVAATLVDEGKLDWDQPATDLLPDFALSDAEATSKIRYRDLLNMSSGVPRYDIPMFLEEADPERVQAMVAEPELVVQPGEAFNYSNQMVALGGFAAAVAAGGTFGPDIDEAYIQLVQERVFDAIGMTRSTLNPATALADDNHATSHTVDLIHDAVLIPLDPSFERFASPIAPAGAVWSSSNEMGRYLATQMALGITPEGTRVVSEENLQETHTPAISMGPSSYGMGWIIGTWNGLTQLEHDGSTIGFVSDMAYLQEPQLGVIVLANRTGGSFFESAVREYVYELAYGLEHTADARYLTASSNLNAATLAGIKNVTLVPAKEEDIADALGTYEHGVSLVFDEGAFLETAYGRAPMYAIGQPNRYLLGGALAGFGVEVVETDGEYAITVGTLADSSQSVTLAKE